MSDHIVCANCGTTNAADDAFCGECGEALAATSLPEQQEPVAPVSPPVGESSSWARCSNCQTLNEAGRTFCQRCGQELGDAAADGEAAATGLAAAAPASAGVEVGATEAAVGGVGSRSAATVIVSVVAIGFIALAGIFLVITFTGSSGDEPTPGQTTPGATLDPIESASAPPTEEPTPEPTPTPTPEPTPEPTPTPTPEPTPEPAPTATAKPTRTPTPEPTRTRRPTSRRAIENDLLARASFIECEPWRKTTEQPFVLGAEGAIRCDRPAAQVSQLAMYTFPEPDALAAFWPVRLSDIEPRPPETGSGCDGGEEGVRAWGNGDIACWVDDRAARIRWTDVRTGMFGVLDASDLDLADLYAWWRTNGRRLGRPLADAPGDPDAGPVTQPIADEPGLPRSFVCDRETRIADPLGRRWKVATVQFLNQRGSERVIYNLERTGSGSGSLSTVAVSAFPIGDPEGHLAGLELPIAGDSIVKVSMGTGVSDVTRLKHYPPKGVQIVKDLSMYTLDDGSTVSLVAVTGEGCYQLRVPAWESPSGNPSTAKIYLDIQP